MVPISIFMLVGNGLDPCKGDLALSPAPYVAALCVFSVWKLCIYYKGACAWECCCVASEWACRAIHRGVTRIDRAGGQDW